MLPGGPHTYSPPSQLVLNEWALGGSWRIGQEEAELNSAPGRILFRFQARDLHLVLGPSVDGEAIRFRVWLDGAPPGDDHGVDVGPDGTGIIDQHRLYQLIRQSGGIRDRTFEIEFQDPRVAVYAFTFG